MSDIITQTGSYFLYNSQLTINAIFDYSDLVVKCTENFLNLVNCSKEIQRKIITAVEELFSNVSKYAFYDNNGMITIHYSYDKTAGNVMIQFFDQGIPFNPLEALDPDVTEKLSNRKIGGLGIYITKTLMDKLSYKYENNTNIVTIIKKIEETQLSINGITSNEKQHE